MPIRLPHDLAAWTARFRDARIPVQATTVEEVALLAGAEAQRGDVDAHQLSEPVGRDPLMALKLMADVARLTATRRAPDSRGGPETVTAALVMMGVGPFFRAFEDTPCVETLLAGQPQALERLRRVLRRAHRGANFALGFAVHRMDDDAPVLHLAALLHDFAEMLLCCHAPALEIERRQRADPALRSASVQRELLGIELAALQQALMRAWSLPELLVRVSDDAHADQAQVRSVELALRVARHTEQGWDNPALPDDLTDAGRLLNLSPAAAESLLRSIDG
jgi:hypothetical protein